jgi:hypothetical protein
VKFNVDGFRAWDRKSITLMGMSGVGKTRLSHLLREADWFHYSGDYRIGTRYLDEAILDSIKEQAMQVPLLWDLLRSDSIFIRNNITINNLRPVSTFLGMLGNPEMGGIGLTEFKRRQHLHRQAEIAAMYDLPGFMHKANLIYGYQHFVNDVGGSLCELDEPGMLEFLAEHSLLLYIQASHADEEALIARAVSSPKPLYYREAFLDEQLQEYMAIKGVDYVSLIDPKDFTSWVFPRLFRARIPRYEAIAADYGYTITTEELSRVKDEKGFLEMLEAVVARSD